MDFNFPKVLIIGTCFDSSTGGGITMTNLFKGWDKKRIGVASSRITNYDYSICENYYQLGYLENKRRFPFFLWQKKEKSGLLPINANDFAYSSLPAGNRMSKKKQLYNNLLNFFGLYHYSRRLTLSSEFSLWLKEFSPDVIYTQLSTLESIRFVSSIYQQYHLPVIIHIMDDRPSTISKKGLFQAFWSNKIDKEFRWLLNKSKVLMSISEAMSEEYLVRYGKQFIPFHNPINVAKWIQQSKKNYQANKTFIILYAGRLGTGIEECFFYITVAINNLVQKGFKIEFHLQSKSVSYVIDTIKKFDFVRIKKPLPYEELPALFASADVLLLPNDFDESSIAFLRYSMPTKASEFMAIGTPILLYASDQTAIVKHAKKNKWAYIVSEKDQTQLENAIVELYENVAIREQIGCRAKEFSINNYNDIIVNQKFRQAFL